VTQSTEVCERCRGNRVNNGTGTLEMPYNEKSKANLKPRGTPETLKRGGSKGRARNFLTFKEIDFCSYMAQSGIIRLAARYAEIPPATARSLLTRPLVKQTIEEFTKKYQEKVTERDAERREERKELSHREWMHQLVTVKTHPIRGDEGIIKLLDLGFKSTGEIQPAKHVTPAIARAQETSGLYAKRQYLPDPPRDRQGD
jgi:hypothetical protein